MIFTISLIESKIVDLICGNKFMSIMFKLSDLCKSEEEEIWDCMHIVACQQGNRMRIGR